jgi:protein-L-isoaspartate O-methyltransferase
MIAPIGEQEQSLMLFKRTEQGVQSERLAPVRFVPLVAGEIVL